MKKPTLIPAEGSLDRIQTIYSIDTNLQLVLVQVMDALEIMDYDKLEIINKGLIVVMHQSSNEGAYNSELNNKSVQGYNKEEKKVLNLDVNESCSNAHETMITLSSAFEDLSDDNVSKGKCLMAQIVKSHVDASNNSIGTLDVDLSQASTDLKSDWDSTSVYQIPDQCEKILGGDIEGVVSLIKKVETKQTYYNVDYLEKDFRIRFHSVRNSEPGDQSKSSILDDSSISPVPRDKVSSKHTIDGIPWSITNARIFNTNDQSSSDLEVKKKPKYGVKGKNPGTRFCYRCGDASHKESLKTSLLLELPNKMALLKEEIELLLKLEELWPLKLVFLYHVGLKMSTQRVVPIMIP
uniref:Uncharacterized protein n=1 Tax=Lactuca sativa TaxID=4236 RepID=A0A9R1WF25_LACSA|nr:hypothetical protein LSAT_V11C200072180 [Lactuca sativa]